MADKLSIAKIKKAVGAKNVKKQDAYMIDGELYVTIDFVSDYFSISSRQFLNWRKKGVSESYEVDRTKLFNLREVEEWSRNNINSTKSRATDKLRKQQQPPIDFSNSDLNDVDKEEADRLLTIEKVKIERTKHLELTKKLIPAEDTDKAMAEIGALHLAQYKSDLKVLPILLENKSKQEITPMLDDHYAARIEDMHTIVNKPRKKDGVKFFDALVSLIGK